MQAGPVSSPSRSDILCFPLPALLTETEQIQGQLRFLSNESVRSDAAAANTKSQRAQQETINDNRRNKIDSTNYIAKSTKILDIC